MRLAQSCIRRKAFCSSSTLHFWINLFIVFAIFEVVLIVLSALGLHLPQWISSTIIQFNFTLSGAKIVIPGIDESADSFLHRYTNFCKTNLQPHSRNIRRYVNRTENVNSSQLCDCVPKNLVGRFVVNITTTPPLDKIVLAHTELIPGGSWAPNWCVPRHRVAVIIPYRNREEHLKALLFVLHPMLQRQLLDYTIFVVEQAQPEVFNKAMLMNAGFREAANMSAFDCYIFHDVDMLPEDDHNFYVCSGVPRHVGAFVDKFDYKIPYDGLFGGVTAFTQSQFELVNGFSNQFYGWGGEDDDMYKRIQAQGLPVIRFPKSVARFNMIKHEPDKGNPFNIRSTMGWRLRPSHYVKDGLSSLVYMKKLAEKRPLYYWLFIALPPPPSNFRYYSRTSAAVSVFTANLFLLVRMFLCFLSFFICISVVKM